MNYILSEMKLSGNNAGRGAGRAGRAGFDKSAARAARRKNQILGQVNKTLY